MKLSVTKYWHVFVPGLVLMLSGLIAIDQSFELQPKRKSICGNERKHSARNEQVKLPRNRSGLTPAHYGQTRLVLMIGQMPVSNMIWNTGVVVT
jgi:hypothetical protein